MALSTASCKGCGRSILWAVAESGARIPLDVTTSTKVYFATENADGSVSALRAPSNAMVTHFATCPNAKEFSSSARKEKEDASPEGSALSENGDRR